MNESAVLRFHRLADQPLQPVTPTRLGVGGFFRTVGDVWDHRQLLGLLVRRDVKARYKDSVLGMLWTLINPLVQLAVYYLVMGQVLGAAGNISGFAVYIFSGLTIYGLFSETLSGATGSIVANSGLVKKVYVPREVFPLAATGSALFTFGVQLLVLCVAAFTLGTPPLSWDLLYVVPSVALILVWALALGLLLSALNVYLRDVQYLTQVLLMLAMWASPIVYAWTMVGNLVARAHLPAWVLEVYTASPLTLSVLGFHRAFWTAATPADFPEHLLLRMSIAFVIGLILLILCQRGFARLQGNFAQEL
ncbi:ABC transporter permease [Microbacterium sp.]|uniref:ABC transporter permease n=1 Tax=Microbacterium sp. TaxID=51671 RepID=UPI0039E38B66